MKPSVRPSRPHFSSGPCAKRPGWSLEGLSGALLGRSHRFPEAKARIDEVAQRSKRLLGIPDDYRVGVVPGSDTGAFEMAMWSLLGARGVDVLSWESFGATWASDLTQQLAIEGTRVLEADYGELPDLAKVDFDNDVVFPWNGTTSGVCIPDGDWIPHDRAGLTLCDATSAVFAMPIAWDKIDVATWSWQKVLGGEAAHGMLCLSPRAVERLESSPPPRPLPKIFRLTKKGKLAEGIFRGETINTPSMLCVEDALDGLKWVDEIGGAEVVRARCQANLAALEEWVDRSAWVDFLARNKRTRSCTSICLALVAATFSALDAAAQKAHVKQMVDLLAREGVAYDIGSYRDAPPGLRIWGGATVETDDLEAMLPWLDWAWEQLDLA